MRYAALAAFGLLAAALHGTIFKVPTTGADASSGQLRRDGPHAANSTDTRTPEAELLQSINALRLEGTYCGAETMSSVLSVARSDVLDVLAREHAQDMAARGYFSHVSPDGFGPAERARRAGYRGRVAENLAWGQATAADALAAWRASPRHCRSLMDPERRAVGLARVVGHRKVLWVAVFGSDP